MHRMSWSKLAPSPSMAVSLLSLVIALGGAGYAANGGSFLLGQSNSATARTILVAPIASSALHVSNLSTAGGASALSLAVAANHPPMTVNSSTRVANLNADMVDDLDANAFSRLIRFESESVSGTLAGGEGYFLAQAFTPAVSGRCLVTVSTQIDGTATTTLGPYLRVGIKRGNGARTTDNFFGHRFPSIEASGSSAELTRSTSVDVFAGQPIRFGAFLGEVSPQWAGKDVDSHVTVLCLSLGTLNISPVVSPASGDARRPQPHS